MITGSMLVMFIVGFIIFVLYIIGLLTMITKQQFSGVLSTILLYPYTDKE